jgi:hypothetical protein
MESPFRPAQQQMGSCWGRSHRPLSTKHAARSIKFALRRVIQSPAGGLLISMECGGSPSLFRSQPSQPSQYDHPNTVIPNEASRRLFFAFASSERVARAVRNLLFSWIVAEIILANPSQKSALGKEFCGDSLALYLRDDDLLNGLYVDFCERRNILQAPTHVEHEYKIFGCCGGFHWLQFL